MPMIGILGGMGPAATVNFLNRLIQLTPAKQDQEHLPVIVYSIPQIPDRSAAILGAGENPLPHLLAGIEFLNRGGAALIAVPCNTSHHWYEELCAHSAAPILHIAQITTDGITPPHDTCVMVLATRGTLASGIYRKELHRRGVMCAPIDDDSQREVDACIWDVKAGAIKRAAERLVSVANDAAANGVSALILGCTELSIAAERAEQLPLKVIDSSHELASAVVRFALEQGWNQMD